MPDTWDLLKAGSTITLGDAWQHISNLGGSGGIGQIVESLTTQIKINAIIGTVVNNNIISSVINANNITASITNDAIEAEIG